MNNRIQALAEQALRDSAMSPIDEIYRANGYAQCIAKAFADRFAQLIIQECAGVGTAASQLNALPAGYTIGDAITNYWNSDESAPEVVAPAPAAPIADRGWFEVFAYRTSAPRSARPEAFESLQLAKAYADGEQFNNYHQVAVAALGQHENYEAGERVYFRFKREDCDAVRST